MKKSNIVPIAQSNAITESRYDFNRLEKNALYCIIRQVRNDYIEQDRDRSAYDNMHVVMHESILAEIADKKHLQIAQESLINLRKRDITIEDERGNWLNVGFINWAEYDAENKVFKVEVSSKIMPYLVDLAERYTVYSLTVAISLKSKWSQRFYELCCQYKNHLERGIPTFHKSIDQLRKMFGLEDMYAKLPEFKSRIIDKAQKELKKSYENNQCDLWFEYVQVGRGEKAEFKFVIHTREASQAQQKQFEELSAMSHAIFKILLSVFPKDQKFCEKCWKHLNMFPDKIERLYGKLNRIFTNYPNGSDRAKVIRYMLEEDFDMSKKTLR